MPLTQYFLVKKICRVILPIWVAVNLSFALTYAAPPTTGDTEEQNRRARQEEQERQQREQRKDVFLQQEKKAAEENSLPEEETAFLITTLILEGNSVERFPWAQQALDKYANHKIGIEGINLIVKRLTSAFIDQGYITTRIVVPEQDLTTGTLRLMLIPGKIGEIRIGETSVKRNWKNAFPTGPGEILNLRHLEQGLEQMKRVPSQDVEMQLVPGKNPGESDVVLSIKESKKEKLVLSIDDSGSKATGKLQTSESISLDNLFGQNDLFNFTVNGDGDRRGDLRGTRGDSIYYSVPSGKSTFTFIGSRYRYHQTIESSTQSFLSSGESSNLEFRVSQLLNRDQKSKTSLEYGIIKANSKSFIEDTEIEAQRKNTTAVKIGIAHTKYIGKATFDVLLSYKQGVPYFGAQPDFAEQIPDYPTTHYKIWLLDISLTKPVTIGKTTGRYNLAFHGQYTDSLLYGTEFISIGSRYTVRGFDGEQTLSAERGWYLRNELDIPLGSSGLEAYVGLDCGAVYGPSAEYLPGRILVGSVVGLKGGTKNLQYELFVGWPLRKPDGFRTATPTYGFQLVCQI